MLVFSLILAGCALTMGSPCKCYSPSFVGVSIPQRPTLSTCITPTATDLKLNYLQQRFPLLYRLYNKNCKQLCGSCQDNPGRLVKCTPSAGCTSLPAPVQTPTVYAAPAPVQTQAVYAAPAPVQAVYATPVQVAQQIPVAASAPCSACEAAAANRAPSISPEAFNSLLGLSKSVQYGSPVPSSASSCCS